MLRDEVAVLGLPTDENRISLVQLTSALYLELDLGRTGLHDILGDRSFEGQRFDLAADFVWKTVMVFNDGECFLAESS